MKKKLYTILFILAIILATPLGIFASGDKVYLQYDGDNYSDYELLKYVKFNGTCKGVDETKDGGTLLGTSNRLNKVGDKVEFPLLFKFINGTIMDGVVYPSGVEKESKVEVIRVPNVKAKPIYLSPEDSLSDIKKKLVDSVVMEKGYDKSNSRFVFTDYSNIIDTTYSKKTVYYKYSYEKGAIPIKKSVDLYRIDTMPAVFEKGNYNRDDVEGALKNAIDYDNKDAISFKSINTEIFLKAGEKHISFDIKDDDKNVVHTGLLTVNVVDKMPASNELVTLKVYTGNGLQAIRFPNTEIYGAQYDGYYTLYKLKKDTPVEIEVKSDNRYSISRASIVYNTTRLSNGKYNTRTVELRSKEGTESGIFSVLIDSLTGDGNVSASLNKRETTITFVPSEPSQLSRNKYDKQFELYTNIDSLPYEYTNEIDRLKTMYDTTLYQFHEKEIMEWEDYPSASSNKEVPLYFQGFGTGTRKIMVERGDKDYLLVGEDFNDIIKSNHKILKAVNINFDKTEINPTIDTTTPSALVDENNIQGDVNPKMSKVKYFSDTSDGSEETTKTVDVSMKVYNELSGSSSITIKRPFEYNFSYVENGEYVYPDDIKNELEKNLYVRINNGNVPVFLNESQARSNSGQNKKAVYIKLGNPSNDHKDLPGFSQKGGNNVPSNIDNIKAIDGEILVKQIALFDNGKEVFRFNSDKDLEKFKVPNKYYYRIGQYHIGTSYVMPTIRYSIGDNKDDISTRSSLKFYTNEITNSQEQVLRKWSNGVISGFNTNYLYVQGGKIGNTSGVVDGGKENPIDNYKNNLFYNRIPKVGEHYLTSVSIEDITDYSKVSFEPTVDENKPYNERQIRDSIKLKTRATLIYDKSVFGENNRVVKEFEIPLDIVIRRAGEERPIDIKIEYTKSYPIVYKGEKPKVNAFKDTIVIKKDNKPINVDYTVVSWDTNKIGNSKATVEFSVDGVITKQPLDILVVNKWDIKSKPVVLNVNREKIPGSDKTKVYDYSGEKEASASLNMLELDNRFNESLKEAYTIKYKENETRELKYVPVFNENENKNIIQIEKIVPKFGNTVHNMLNVQDSDYMGRTRYFIYSDYYKNNTSKDVSQGWVILETKVTDRNPGDEYVLDKFKVGNETYYLYYQVYDTNGELGPKILMSRDNIKDLAVKLNIVNNYKENFVVKFRHKDNTKAEWSIMKFRNSEVGKNDIPESILSKLVGYEIKWDKPEQEKLILNTNPRSVVISLANVDYKINLVDNSGSPLKIDGIQITGKTESGTKLKDILNIPSNYILGNSESVKVYNNFVFDTNNKETPNITLITREKYTSIPYDTKTIMIPGSEEVNKFARSNTVAFFTSDDYEKIAELSSAGILTSITTSDIYEDIKNSTVTGKFVFNYYDGSKQFIDFKFTYIRGYEITDNNFKDNTITLGGKLPRKIDWIRDLTGIDNIETEIMNYFNGPGVFDVYIRGTDKNGKKFGPIIKQLTVVDKHNPGTEPDPNPGTKPEPNPNPGTEPNPNPGTDKDKNIDIIKPGMDITPDKPKDTNPVNPWKGTDSDNKGTDSDNKGTEVIVPGVDITPGNKHNSDGNTNIGNNDNNSGIISGTDNGGVVSGADNGGTIPNENNPIAGDNFNYSGSTSNSGSGTPSYKDDKDDKDSSKDEFDNSISSQKGAEVLKDTVIYSKNIMLNKDNYTTESYKNFTSTLELVKNKLIEVKNSKSKLEDSDIEELNELLVKSIRELQPRGLLKDNSRANYIEIDLNKHSDTLNIKDSNDNIIGKMNVVGKFFISNDRTMASLRDISDILNIDVKWSQVDRTAYFKNKDDIIAINIDSGKILVNGKPGPKLSSGIKMIEDRIYLPLTDISKLFKLTNGNEWDGIDQDIEFYSNYTVRIYQNK